MKRNFVPPFWRACSSAFLLAAAFRVVEGQRFEIAKILIELSLRLLTLQATFITYIQSTAIRRRGCLKEAKQNV